MTSAKELDPGGFEVAKSHLNFPVVGFGASVGEVGALQKLLQKIAGRVGHGFRGGYAPKF